MPTTPNTRRRWRRLGPVLAALAVAGTLLAAAVWVSALRSEQATPAASGTPGGVPPTLHLSGSGAVRTGTPAAEILGQPGGAAGYRLAARLPSGPGTGLAYRLGPDRASEADVTRVAQAIGISAAPRRAGPGWVAESAGGRLVVVDRSGRWSYASGLAGCLPPLPAEADAQSGCAVSGSVSSGRSTAGSWPNLPAGPTASVVRRAAEVLGRLAGPAPAVQRSGWTFWVPGVAAGQRVLGWDTMVTVDPTGTPVSATGYLGRPTVLARYPVISAREAWQRLQGQPRMLSMTPDRTADRAMPEQCLLVRGRTGCAVRPPTVLVDIRLGLQLVTDRDAGVVAVPAWIFTSGAPGRSEHAVTAITDRYLGTPTPADQPTADGPPSAIPPAGPSGGSGPG